MTQPYNLYMGLLFLAVGLFFSLSALANWRWFLEQKSVRSWRNRLGPQGARILYVLLGFAFAGVGVLRIVKGWA